MNKLLIVFLLFLIPLASSNFDINNDFSNFDINGEPGEFDFTYPQASNITIENITNNYINQTANLSGIPNRSILYNDDGEINGSSSWSIDIDNTLMGSSPTFPTASLERTTSLTTGTLGVLRLRTLTNGTMADDFGTSMSFAVGDSDTPTSSIAIIGARRNGADNSGKFFISTVKLGTSTDRFTVDEEGISEIYRSAVSATSSLAQNLILTAQTSATGNGFGAGLYFRNQESTGVNPWTMGYIGIARDGGDTSGIYQTWIASGGTLRKVYELDKDGQAYQTNYINGYGYHLVGNINNGNLVGTTNANVHAQAVNGFEANANSGRQFGLYAPSSIHTSRGTGWTNTAMIHSAVYPTVAIANSLSTGQVDIRAGGSATSNNIVSVNPNGLGVFTSPTSTYTSGIDISDGTITAIMGADNNFRTRTNNNQKLFRLGTPHYTNSEEPIAVITSSSSNVLNRVNIGGGTVLLNAANRIDFFTANNQTTLTGTLQMTISNETIQMNLPLNVSGDVNVSTLYYDALVAKSPHVLGADNIGYTRVCFKATDGKVVLQTVQKVGLEYKDVYVEDTQNICDKKLIKNQYTTQELMDVQGVPTYVETKTVEYEKIYSKEKSTQTIKEVKESLEDYQVDRTYAVGSMFKYNGEAFEVIQSHTSQIDWNPKTTASLYKKLILFSYGEITEWKQPQGSHDAYPLGAKVTYQGWTYESTVNNNVWSPLIYGWKKI